MKVVLIFLAIPALILPTAALIYIIIQALPALHLNLFFGDDGNQIISQISGSLLLMSLACVLAAPIALSLALFHAFWASPKQKIVLMTVLHVLQGIPPIVYGLCGLVLLVHLLHWGISLLVGAVILAVVVLPLLSTNAIHALERIPKEQTEAGFALGLNKTSIITKVWLPSAWPSMLTGLLLSMARALSETAPILFTATVFSGITWPDSIFSPVTSLQTHIFYLAQEGSNIQAIQTAWASAVVLLALVLSFSLTACFLRRYERTI